MYKYGPRFPNCGPRLPKTKTLLKIRSAVPNCEASGTKLRRGWGSVPPPDDGQSKPVQAFKYVAGGYALVPTEPIKARQALSMYQYGVKYVRTRPIKSGSSLRSKYTIPRTALVRPALLNPIQLRPNPTEIKRSRKRI